MKPKEEKIREAVHLFIGTDRMHRKLTEKKIGVFGLHRSQHIMLMQLARQKKSVSQKEIAEMLEISQAAATVAIKKLSLGGYIEKSASDKDGRYNEIRITAKGIKIVEDSKKVFAEIDRTMTEGISDEELEAFISCVKKMQNNLKEKGQF